MFDTWPKRYLLGGASLAIFLIVATVMNPWLPPEKQVNRQMMGLDFLSFYTAGVFAHQGRVGDLYDLADLRAFQKKIAAENHLDLQSVAPWWNPPIYAVALEPFSRMSFDTTRWTWLAINVLCLAVAIALLMQMLPADCDWRCRALVPLLICVSMPTIQAIGHAQNSAISLLILTVAITLAQKRRPFVAGLIIALMGYKPQMALAFAGIFTLVYGWRAFAGFILAAGSTVVLNILILPGTITRYISQLPANLHAIQYAQTYIWERQITLGGFWHLLLQGR
ncbi:MAG TPA: glycosyltransferase family 87 protein, partial [Tepidisphaeraceae bacterium]|nr:glycosyltransferase family 87 protein [Tepidisphaeraceae bacterium]